MFNKVWQSYVKIPNHQNKNVILIYNYFIYIYISILYNVLILTSNRQISPICFSYIYKEYLAASFQKN